MGRMHSLKNRRHIIVGFVLAVIGLLWVQSNAYAQQECTIQNTLPTNYSYPPSEFGDNRNHSDGTEHTGTDFFYPNGQKIVVPEGCKIQENTSGNIVWEQNSKKANGEPAGYGYYMVLDCGTFDGDTVKMRLAHLPKNPYNAATKEILQGDSGNASGGAHHYHTEVIIGDRPVDPQCVLGIVKSNENADGASSTCKSCPIQSGVSANLCDAEVRNTLIAHGQECTHNAVRAIEGGSSVDPDRIRGSGITSNPDSAYEPGSVSGTGDGHGDNDSGPGMGSNSPTGGTGNTPTPPEVNPEPDPEPEPPGPDDPGNPGDAPNLTPEPDESPEKISGCAADTWTAMVNQAVMETRREDILNKRFIVKPDTVLDYSCFDNYVKEVADDAGPVFSETKKWAHLDVDLIGKVVTVERELGSKSLDGALMDIVQSTAINYRRRQFNQPLLSGTAPVAASAGSTNCDLMAQVWKAAKCKNFDDVDVFYTFDDLKTKEPREFPPNMSCE